MNPLNSNPYQSPVPPPVPPLDPLTCEAEQPVLAIPPTVCIATQTAVACLGVFLLTTGAAAWLRTTHGLPWLYGPNLVWLVAAIGLYFRWGPMRRLVLLVGSMSMLATLLLAIVAWLQGVDNLLVFGVSLGEPKGLTVTLWAAGFWACLLYPVIRLWPTRVRSQFYDRLPPRHTFQRHRTDKTMRRV